MTDLSIQAAVAIHNHTVEINGEQDFSAPDAESTVGFLKTAYRHYGIKYGKFFKMDVLSKLGFLASEVLLAPRREETVSPFAPEESGVVLYNASSSLYTDYKYQQTISDIPSPAVFVYTLPNILIGEICIRNGFRGESTFFIEETFSPERLEHYVRLLFATTPLQQCLTGWTELTMDGRYQAVLYLISRGEGLLPFTVSNLNQLFQKDIL